MAIGNRGQGCLQVGEGLDAVDLGGFDQGGDAAFIVTSEERVLAIEGYWAVQIFDPVAIDLHAAIGQEFCKRCPDHTLAA